LVIHEELVFLGEVKDYIFANLRSVA